MKKLRVFGLPWHVGHQFELARLPWFRQYDLLINPYRTWGLSSRPLPRNCRWVTCFRRNYYDLAILHLDQQCIYKPEEGERIHKGRLFKEVRDTIGNDCPVIIINHMTPFHDRYSNAYVVDYFKKLVGNDFMIVNSYEAAKQWGFGYPVIHGMKVNEWWDLPKEPRVVTAISQAGMEKAYRRLFLYQVIRRLRAYNVPFVWIGVDKVCRSFDEYREFLGRSLVYFNPTWQSPRPRARTEAMLSGCCVVTTPYHDAIDFIEHGVNGFLTSRKTILDPRVIDNPDYTAKLLKMLVLEKPDLALKVGQEGKKLARRLFNHKNFVRQWKKVLDMVLY